MTRLRFIALILILTFLTANTQAQFSAASRRKIQDYLDARESRGEFGGTVVVRSNGREVYRRTAGRANYEFNNPITSATKFRIASVTKSFTAAAVSLLAKQNKLSLDDPLSKFLTECPNGDNITVRHLLRHRSGIGDAGPVSDPTQRLTLREAIERFREASPHFPPGTAYRYSGAGYILLAHIVEMG